MTIRNALILAGAILLAALGLTYAENAEMIDPDTRERAMGVVIGLVLVIMANFAPKTLEPMCGRSDPARIQALQRFSGWTLVLAGMGYSAAWLLMPIGRANLIAMSIVAAGLGLVMIRLGWVVLGSRGKRSSAES